MDQKRILLVEDEAIIALTETRQLQNAGYDVKHVMTGEEAVSILNDKEHGIDLVLMDIDLGSGMDGTSAAQEILKVRNIPVIFLSSHTEKEVVEKTENITSYGYVVKNSGIIVLDASIKMALRLFDANAALENQRMELQASREELESALEELQSSNEEFEAVNEELILSQEELIRSEFSLRKQTAMLNKVFEILPIGLWIADRNGTLLTANAAGKKIWGAEPHVPQEEYGVFRARRLPSYEEIAPDDWALSHTINKGITVVDELLEIEAFDGKKKIILNYTAPVLDDDGTIEGAIIVNQDITEHRLAEDALKRNEALQSSILANISDVISILDSNGVVTLESPNVEKFFGWKPDELKGMSAWDIIHRDDLAGIKSTFSTLLEAPGISRNGECRYRCADGTYRWISFTAVNLINDSSINGILVNYRDISEAKSIEQNLSRSEIENRSIINYIPDLVFNVDRNGVILNYRAPEGSMLYTPPDKFLGKRIFDVLPPDVAEPSLKNIERAFATSEHVTMEYILPSGNKILYYENRIIPLSESEVLCFIRDITDRREAENRLRRSEAKFRSYIENSPYPVFVTDDKGNYVDVNRAAAELTGYTEDELLKMKIGDLVYEEDIKNGEEHFRKVAETGNSTGDLRYVTKDGTVRYWTVKAVKLTSERFLGFVNDITELKGYERKLKESIGHRDMLLREMQHRTKNNLNVVSGLLNLEMANLNDNNAREIFADAISRIYTLSSIYDRLQITEDISMIELDSYLKDLTGSIFSTCNVDHQSINLITVLEQVKIDTRRAVPIGIILNELLTNICKYAFPDNRAGEVKISLTRTGDSITLCAEDNGIGLPVQLDIESAESTGLLLIRMLAEQLNGELNIRSSKGEGTKICITLQL